METVRSQLEDRVRRTGIARHLTRGSASRSALLGLLMATVGIVLAFVLSDFALGLMALFFAFAILAYSIDLLWGENRIVSFGHGAFFAGGAYVGGLILVGHSYHIVGGHTNYLLGGTEKTSALDSVLGSLNSATAHG